MQVKTGMLFEPGKHLGMFVCGVVVEDQMHVEFERYLAVDVFEKGKPLLMPMLLLGHRNHLAAEIIERRKEGRRAVPVVIVGARGNVAGAQRQTGLAALQSLALAFLVSAEDDGVFRR